MTLLLQANYELNYESYFQCFVKEFENDSHPALEPLMRIICPIRSNRCTWNQFTADV